MNLTCSSRAAILLCSSVCFRRDLCSIFTCETAVSFHYSCADKLNNRSYVLRRVVPPGEVQPISSSSPLIWGPWPPAPFSSSLLARTTTFSPHTIPVWSKKKTKKTWTLPHRHWTRFYSSCHVHISFRFTPELSWSLLATLDETLIYRLLSCSAWSSILASSSSPHLSSYFLCCVESCCCSLATCCFCDSSSAWTFELWEAEGNANSSRI